jgi:hypothetical protein
MSLPNPDIKFAKSRGIDLPLMTVYLVGRISGNCMDKCLSWRKEIIDYYRNYKPINVIPKHQNGEKSQKKLIGYESYPISFLCPLNSGESKTADELGLKSHLPKNLIYDKDILSLHKADCIVANLDDFMEDGIEELLDFDKEFYQNTKLFNSKIGFNWKEAFFKLQEKITNRRANLGSHFEVSVALYLRKPVVLIAGTERNKYILENHPFFGRASVIVLNTEQLLKEKWLQTLYKAMAGSTEEY